MDKAKLQMIVVIGILVLWVFAFLVAIWDGNTALRATTPLVTLILGWLFTERVTS